MLDGDWCWEQGNHWDFCDRNKEMVMDNICYLLGNFLSNPRFETVIFSWVMQLPEIHAELLARDVAARLNLPYVDALERTRNTRQQARLDDHARRVNLRGAFQVSQSVAGRRIILVDDVCTTGSTARECAKALKSAGAERVYLLCYTRAGKRAVPAGNR
jgi:glutamine phosphoribosylpyrophosphate amidotransferase